MRKRLVMGAIAAVVIGVAAYFLSQPRKDSVEYHKRAYLRASSSKGQAGQWLRAHAPLCVSGALHAFQERRKARHRRALVALGFLEHRQVQITDVPMSDVDRFHLKIFSQARNAIARDPFRFVEFSLSEPDILNFIAPREDMPILELLIRIELARTPDQPFLID